jgi:hypothetical protein
LEEKVTLEGSIPVPNGDPWKAIDVLRDKVENLRANGCAHLDEHRERADHLQNTIDKLAVDVKWMLRTGIGILVALAVDIVKGALK